MTEYEVIVKDIVETIRVNEECCSYPQDIYYEIKEILREHELID